MNAILMGRRLTTVTAEFEGASAHEYKDAGRKRYLIFSDVHGNYDALKNVLRKMDDGKYDHIICLGDVVGYGAEPVRCFEALRDRCTGSDTSSHEAVQHRRIELIIGNHEAMLFGEESADGCSELGRISVAWTAEQCRKRILRDVFSDSIRYRDMFFCHTGEMPDKGRWAYLNDREDIVRAFGDRREKFVFYGHTHRMRLTVLDQSGTIREDRQIMRSEDIVIPKESQDRYLINTGSVGQARDTITDCGYVEFEENDEQYILHFIREKYQTFRAYRKIVKYGCGERTAQYMIREYSKKKWYRFWGCLLHWWNRS